MRPPKQPSREDVAKRLKRAAGHLYATLDMIEANKPCAELAQQLQAVEGAVATAKRQLVYEQMQHALGESEVTGATLRELKHLTRYLQSNAT